MFRLQKSTIKVSCNYLKENINEHKNTNSLFFFYFIATFVIVATKS